MVKRRISNHEELLKEFGSRLKKEINQELKFWRKQNPKTAEAMSIAYGAVIRELKLAAQDTNVPLQDIGIEDYDVPNISQGGMGE